MNVLRKSIGFVIVLSTASVLAQSQPPPPPPPPQSSARNTEQSSTAVTPRNAKGLGGFYAGSWATTNRKLDGTMKCELKDLGKDRWQGRFWGVWQGVAFDYTVQFETAKGTNIEKKGLSQRSEPRTGDSADSGQKVQVSGKAMIDGAHYDWKGTLSPDNFDIQFTGSRYNGYCELARVKEKPPRKLAEVEINRK